MSYNKVIIIGNLTRDAELRQTQGGTSVLSMSVAVNERHTAKDGTARESTAFIDVKAFGKTAENIAKFFHKGDAILLDGKLAQETWDDKQTGQKRSKLIVVANAFEFVGSKKESREESPKPRQRDLDEDGKDPNFDDDIPF